MESKIPSDGIIHDLDIDELKEMVFAIREVIWTTDGKARPEAPQEKVERITKILVDGHGYGDPDA